jgi:DNA-binding response OmpR family regulator
MDALKKTHFCVLIIDDTPMIISALSRMLLPFYKVKVARDGEEGLKLVERHEIDLILLDINMPGITGFDVITKLGESEKTSGIPVIFLTASEEEEDKSLAFSMGAVDYIRKPFVDEDVLSRVRLHIR